MLSLWLCKGGDQAGLDRIQWGNTVWVVVFWGFLQVSGAQDDWTPPFRYQGYPNQGEGVPPTYQRLRFSSQETHLTHQGECVVPHVQSRAGAQRNPCLDFGTHFPNSNRLRRLLSQFLQDRAHYPGSRATIPSPCYGLAWCSRAAEVFSGAGGKIWWKGKNLQSDVSGGPFMPSFQ